MRPKSDLLALEVSKKLCVSNGEDEVGGLRVDSGNGPESSRAPRVIHASSPALRSRRLACKHLSNARAPPFSKNRA